MSKASKAIKATTKKAVTKKPAVVMQEPAGFTVVPEDSVVEVDSKGVGDVVEGPAPSSVASPGGGMAMPEVAEADIPKDMSVSAEQGELARMAARIAELEDQNKELANRPIPAAQGLITARKNPGEDIVQRTASGNMRVTHDPSPQLREEMDTQEVKDV